ncbi:hypothetical protein [Scytonema sp. HK-05]|nr:hypothetical protein [Scytonema sp. HK-05]
MPLQEIPVWSMVQTSSDNIEDKFNESIEQRAKREEWALVFKLSLEDSKN